MTTFVGYNIHSQGVKDPNALIDYVRQTQPAWLVVMDGVELAKQLKAASPKTNVIVREWQPDGTLVQRSPLDYLARMRQTIGDSDLWCYTDNEVGTQTGWHTLLLKLNATSHNPLKLCILNISVGTPRKVEDWSTPDHLELLRLASQYREWCVIGLHEYFDVVPTSGLIGGLPGNAGKEPDIHAAPGSTGRNLIPSDRWPTDETALLTKWHCGRFEWLVKACQEHNIRPPRLVLTEFGADNVEFKDWKNILRKTDPFQDLRGFQSLRNQWSEWYPRWTHEETYFNALTWLEKYIYRGSAVEGACVYCYGWKDKQWEQFSVENAPELLQRLLNHAKNAKNSVIQPPAPTPIAKPAYLGRDKRVKAKSAYNVRTGNGTLYPRVGSADIETLVAGDEVVIYPETGVTHTDSNCREWVWCEIKTGRHTGLSGWLCLTEFKYETVQVTGESPIIVLPPPPPVIQEYQEYVIRIRVRVPASAAACFDALGFDSQSFEITFEKVA